MVDLDCLRMILGNSSDLKFVWTFAGNVSGGDWRNLRCHRADSVCEDSGASFQADFPLCIKPSLPGSVYFVFDINIVVFY